MRRRRLTLGSLFDDGKTALELDKQESGHGRCFPTYTVIGYLSCLAKKECTPRKDSECPVDLEQFRTDGGAP